MSELSQPTHFNFEHKIFAVEGVRFALSKSDHEPILLLDVGEHEAAVTFDAILQEFNIAPGSPDGLLLEQVKSGLKYVKDIRPGDTIPQELLDGSASWSIDDSHKIRALNKIKMRIAILGSPSGGIKAIPQDIAKFLEEPETKMWLESGLDRVGLELGLGEGRAPSVTSLVDQIGRELAYIEALRDRYRRATEILAKLRRVAELHKSERHFIDEIQRCEILIGPPVKDFRGVFDAVDKRSGKVVELLQSIDSGAIFIRECRDELHQKMLIWDELIEKWSFDLFAKSKANREAVQFTYRFVSHNFPQSVDW